MKAKKILSFLLMLCLLVLYSFPVNAVDPGAPIAVDDSYSVIEDSISNAMDVLTNDSDPDGDTISITEVTQGANGTVDLNDSSVSYTPNADFVGADSFSYAISDGKGRALSATVSVTVTNVNDGPEANDELVTVEQDSADNSIDVLDNDSDLDDDTISITEVTQGANGTVDFDASSVNYTPNADFVGADSFTYTISDGNGGSDTATVSVTVASASVNGMPNAVDDSYEVSVNSVSNTMEVLANDSDPDGDMVSITEVTQGANGTVDFDASSVNYTPNADFVGADSFSYTISDGKGGSDTATVSVTVASASVNGMPNAVDDSYEVSVNSVSNTMEVLANDSDPDGDTISITEVTQGANGTVDFDASSVSYTPNADFDGADSFSYTISDGKGGSDMATVSVTVTSLATVFADGPIPVTTWEELFNVRNDLAADYILMNDLDESSAGYDIYVGSTVSGEGWLPIGEFVPAEVDGLVLGEWDANELESTPFSGSFDGGGNTISGLYINRPDDFGMGLFGYVKGNGVDDGIITNLELVNADITGHRHVGVLAGYTWLAAISNVETSGDLYTNHNGGGLAGTIRAGTLVQNCSSSTAVVGDVVVRNSLRTGGLIGAVHDSTVEDSFTSGRVQGDFFDTGGLAGSIYEGTQITRCHTTGTVYGTGAVGALIGSTNQASFIEDCYTTGDVIATGREIGGLIGNINHGTTVKNCYATGDVTGNGQWVGGLVGIVCNGSIVQESYATGNVNNGGVFTGGLVGYLSSGASILDSYATGNPAGNGGVGGLVGSVYGYSDEDDGPVIVVGATIERSYSTGSPVGPYAVGGLVGASDEGTVTDGYWDTQTSGIITSSGGTGLGTAAMLQQLSFTGWDFDSLWSIEEGLSYPYFVWQGDENIPYAPTLAALNDSVDFQEDSTDNLIDVLANDIYNGAGALEITSVTQGAHGTVTVSAEADTLIYTPDADYNGNDSFKYTVSDGIGQSDTATVYVRINSVNDNPAAVDDAAEVNKNSSNNVIDVLANDTDVDRDALTVTGATQGSNGSVTSTASNVSYTPDAGFSGADSFTYTISDGNEGSATATVTITVTNNNNAPTALDDSTTVNEGSENNPIDVLANDSDADDDTLTVTGVTQGSNGSVTSTASNASYTPDPDFNGTDTFTYTISDGNGGSDTATVTVTVTGVNNVPTAVDDLATVNEDGIGNLIDVLTNDSDLDDDTLSITGVTQASNGSVTSTASNVSYTPDADFNGTDSFTYTISDGKGGSDTATVTVTVTNINDAPAAADDTKTVYENSDSNPIDVLANDSDADDDTLNVTGVTQGTNGSVTFTASDVSYTPQEDFVGTDSFTYTIRDGNGGSDTAAVTVTVKRRSTGGGGGGGGGGGSEEPTAEVVVITKSTLQSTSNSTEIPSVTNDGSATADISSAVVNALLEKAEETKANGKEDLLEVIVEVEGEVEGIEFNLQSKALKKLATSSEASFKLTSPFISMTFDHEVLKAIDAVNNLGDITIAAREVKDSELSTIDKLLVKNRPVYDLTIRKGSTKITSFGEGHVTVAIPYEPKAGEDLEAIVVYFLSDQKDLQMVTGRYDDQLKSVVFETNHFSKFVIGYNAVSFSDVPAQAWYKNAVDFIVARGYASGTGENRFDPEAQLKRADFVVMLMNTYASELQKLSGNQQISNFDDAGNTYYTDELLAAKRLGLINGTGQNLFEPEQGITRQEMMVIMHNVLKAIGEVPAPIKTLQLVSFNDSDQVADWAEEAITSFVNSGIVAGDNYNLNPEDFMKRAEIAQILFNLLSK